MVLDCGGGTVDITMHRCLSKAPLQLAELAKPEGGDWGSTYVDAEFSTFLEELLGAGHFADLRKTVHYLEIMVRALCAQLHVVCDANCISRHAQQKSFEELKVDLREGETAPRNLSLAPTLEILDIKLNDLVAAYNAAHPDDGVLEMRGKSNVRLPPQLMRRFFETVFLRIEGKVTGTLRRMSAHRVALLSKMGRPSRLIRRFRHVVARRQSYAAGTTLSMCSWWAASARVIC